METTRSTDGVRIAWETIGEGPPLVLVHPSLSSSSTWRQLGYVDVLAPSYRLVLIDMRGHGASDKPTTESDYAMHRLVDDVIAVLDELDIGSTHFFGYSLGGRVGFGCGALAPDRFQSLIIGGGTYHSQVGAFDRVSYPGALDTLARHGVDRFLDKWSTYANTALPESVKAMFKNNDVNAIVPYLRQMELDRSLEEALPSITVPSLLFAGEHDEDRLPASRAAASLMPSAELVEIPGANHVSAFMRTNAVADLVTGFLQRVTSFRPDTTELVVRQVPA